jgi:Mn2+/Fe2+ NRAMP family transporter
MYQDTSSPYDAKKLTTKQGVSHSFIKVIGPGLLFAGSAIGVSHLVQSTRAGAMYGLGLVIFILLANFAKYPCFLFAPRYAAATGRSVLSSYRRQGRPALVFYGLSTLLTMFIATAVTLLVASGLIKATLNLDVGILPIAFCISIIGISLLQIGNYHWFDRIMKLLVLILTVFTIVATILVFPTINWQDSGMLIPETFDLATILFIAALVGWMPTPPDVSVWQSLWTVEKIRDAGYMPTTKEAKLDFDIGYIVTIILAICFVIMGTAVMHGTDRVFESGAASFATQIINLYRQALGDWSGALVGIAAFSVLFSTFLTVLDGFPRGLANLILCFEGKDESIEVLEEIDTLRKNMTTVIMIIMVIVSLIILQLFFSHFQKMIDFAATISFLTAPVFAYLNHRAIVGKEVNPEARPGFWLRIWSIAGIATLSCFSVAYLYLTLAY